MKLTFEGKCPKCMKDISIHATDIIEEDKIVSKEVKEMEKYAFEVMKNACQNDYKRRQEKGFFDDFLDMVGGLSQNNAKTSISYVNDYFNGLERHLNSINDPKKLLKKSKELSKTKVEVNKTVKKEVEARKKRILALIEKKLKRLEKGGKNHKI